jgi:tetratricopeptide (TPR) repeat protein
MKILAGLLLLAAPLCAQQEDWEAARKRYLGILAQKNTTELSLTIIEPDLALFPPQERLRLAKELAAARPASPVLQVALAKAYCANHMSDQGRRILAKEGTFRRDEIARRLWIQALPQCGELDQAFAALVQVVKTAVAPNEAVGALRKLLERAAPVSGKSALTGLKRQWRSQVDAGSKDPRPYRLLAEVYARESDPGLESLCEEAIRSFPEEDAFYDLLAQRFLAEGRWRDAETSRRDQLQSLREVRAFHYYDLADVYVRSGRSALALRTLREAPKDPRFWPADRADLENKILVLEAGVRSRSEAPPLPACSFHEEAGSRSVDCGGQRLEYYLDAGRFAGQDDPARAAPLACRLMERVEETRFHDRGRKNESAIPPDVREMLKAAGYLDR